MGYFSARSLKAQEAYTDRSYPSFEEQLKWRYEALQERYLALSDMNSPCVGDDVFTTNDDRYAPIAYFTTMEDVYRAMELAVEDLEVKCGITVGEEGSIENEDGEEQDDNQITMLEIVLLPTWFQTAAAA